MQISCHHSLESISQLILPLFTSASIFFHIFREVNFFEMEMKLLTIADSNGIVLRHATDNDLAPIDDIAVLCWAPIYESYISMLGSDWYKIARPDPEMTWQERKIGQIRRHYEKHPEWMWTLEKQATVIGFLSFHIDEEKSTGIIGNNGVHPEHAGHGLGKFMYRHLLQHFREQGLRFAKVGTGLDEAHLPARRAYEGVGFDRSVPTVDYWQDLSLNNEGSLRKITI